MCVGAWEHHYCCRTTLKKNEKHYRSIQHIQKNFKIKARVKTQNTTGKRLVYFQVSSNQFWEEKKR